MTDAVIGIGTLFQNSVGGTPELWVTVAETLDLSLPALSRDSIDISQGNAPSEWREFIPGMRDGGEITLSLNFNEDSYTELEAEFDQGIKKRRILFPDGVFFPFYAFLTKLETTIPIGDRVVASASFKVSGRPGPLRPRWLPTDLTGLVAWYRADREVFIDDGVTPVSEGSLVRQWNDLSGNGNHLRQTIESQRPTFQSRGFNLKPTLRFTASETTSLVSIQNLSGLGLGSSWAIAGQLIDDPPASNRDNGRALSYLGVNHAGQDFNSTGSAGVIVRDATNAAFRTDRNSVAYVTTTIAYDTTYRLMVIFDNTNVTSYVNNIQREQDALVQTFDSTGLLGVGSPAPPASPAFWDGSISEIVIVNTALTEAERLELDLYLYDVWWTPRLGYAANRARWLEHSPVVASPPTYTQVMGRSGHRAWTDINTLQIFAANVRVSVATDLAEFGYGTAATVTASIEYPEGTFTRITFSGAIQGTIPNADILLSDLVDIPGGIPSGAIFWVRQFWQNPSGVFFNQWRDFSTYGDIVELDDGGLTDKTMGGELVSAGTFSFPPAGIIALTDLPSIGIIGDSIAAGKFDIESPPYIGDVGSIAKSLAAHVPMVNLSIPGAAVNAVNTHYWGTLGNARKKILRYTTHMILELGINDLAGFFMAAQTSAQMEAHYIAFHQALFGYGLDPAAKIFQTTILPYTTSTDGWITIANQTPALANDAHRINTNNLIRAGLPFVTDFYELADVLEEPDDGGKFDTPPKPTDDGLHLNPTGYSIIAASGVITIPED